MVKNQKIAEVLLPVALDKSFSYLLDEKTDINVGDIVLVNFINRNIYGVVLKIREQKSDENFKIKPIIKKDDDIKIGQPLLNLIEFSSNYNLGAKGLFLKLAISILNSKNNQKHKIYYEINQDIANLDLKITPKRQQVIDSFLDQKKQEAREIIKKTNISNSTLNDLTKKGLLIKKQEKLEVEKITQNIKPQNFNLKTLSKRQREVVDFLKEQILLNKYSATLIEGVTGSGKTEVYFHAISEILNKKDGQILILLPEIILTDQLFKRFSQQFGFEPTIWNSKIDNKIKKKIIYSLKSGDVRVVIGTRSALFLPFSNLKMIVVDEEHESSFKQEDIVNYHGRDMAIMRANFENIPIFLASATPSIESYVNAKNGKYYYQILTDKFFNNKKPEIEVVDMRKEKLPKNNHISQKLQNSIAEALKHNQQILLFLNRRGYSPVTLCKDCGVKISCVNCSSYMTYHKQNNKLICHHCGYESKPKNQCDNCQSIDSFINIGVGAEKISEEIQHLFPKSKIALITSDTMKNQDENSKIITKIVNNEVNIIIGTQIIAKGHHFPNLALIGIINGDASFNNSDLRACEKSFQLLTQVIGRAGREKHDAKIFLQSYNTDNTVFRYIKNQKQEDFLDFESKNRQIAHMPPFSKLAAIIFIGKDEDLVIKNAKLFFNFIPQIENIEIFGPAPMPLSKVRNNYYYRLLIKCDKKLNIQKFIRNIVDSNQNKISSKVRVKIDVDPL